MIINIDWAPPRWIWKSFSIRYKSLTAIIKYILLLVLLYIEYIIINIFRCERYDGRCPQLCFGSCIEIYTHTHIHASILPVYRRYSYSCEKPRTKIAKILYHNNIAVVYRSPSFCAVDWPAVGISYVYIYICVIWKHYIFSLGQILQSHRKIRNSKFSHTAITTQILLTKYKEMLTDIQCLVIENVLCAMGAAALLAHSYSA